MHRYAGVVKKAQTQNDDVVLQGEGRLYSHFMNTLGLQCQPSEHHCSSSSQEVHEHSIASSSLNWFLQRIQTLVSEFVIVLQTRGSTHLALNLMKMYIIWWANITQGVGSFWMSQHKKAKNQNFAKRDRLLLGQSNLLFLFFVDYRHQRLPWIYVYFLHSGNLQFHEREFSFPNPYKLIWEIILSIYLFDLMYFNFSRGNLFLIHINESIPHICHFFYTGKIFGK